MSEHSSEPPEKDAEIDKLSVVRAWALVLLVEARFSS